VGGEVVLWREKGVYVVVPPVIKCFHDVLIRACTFSLELFVAF
jgi:hypothetical protein